MIQLTNAPTAITAGCKAALRAVWALAILGLTQAGGLAAEAISNQDCLECHTDPTTARTVAGKAVPLAVFATNAFQKSVHSRLLCTDCHNTVKDLVHPAGLPPAQCASCHASETAQYTGSIHGMSKARGASAAAG